VPLVSLHGLRPSLHGLLVRGLRPALSGDLHDSASAVPAVWRIVYVPEWVARREGHAVQGGMLGAHPVVSGGPVLQPGVSSALPSRTPGVPSMIVCFVSVP
jgi:hypothetical protein